MPPQGALLQEALFEGTVVGGPPQGAWTRPRGMLALLPRRKIPQRQLLSAFLLLLLIADGLSDDLTFKGPG